MHAAEATELLGLRWQTCSGLLPMMPPKKAKTAPRKGKPGLALTAESPIRPLANFLKNSRKSSGGDDDEKDEESRKKSARDKKLKGDNHTVLAPATSAHREDTYMPANSRPQQSLASSLLWTDESITIPKEKLAIHKKKIEQVEGWLRDALDGRPSLQKYRRVLVLHGPAGAGKSTLIYSLARRDALDFDVTDWNDDALQGPSGSSRWDNGTLDFSQSDDMQQNDASFSLQAAARFNTMLSGARQFASLHLEDDAINGRAHVEGSSSIRAPPSKTNTSQERRQILLLDDLPNLFHAPTKAAFWMAIETFVNKPSVRNVPLVLCITETTPRFDDWGGNHAISSWRDRADDTMNVRLALPETLRQHPRVMMVPFNSVAPTILRKGLRSVMESARDTSTLLAPASNSARGKELVEAILHTSNGDIRSAINTLQFVLANGDKFPSSAKQGTKRTSQGNAKRNHTESIQETLSAATGREASLAVFHALGRILYNKRIGDTMENDDEPESEGQAIQEHAMHQLGVDPSNAANIFLPPHMRHLDRRRSKVDIESLWRSMPLDASTLQAFQHQNYPPFCDTIEQCASLIEGLSDAESLRPSHEEWSHTGVIQYYSFLISTHSTLLALPSPVSHRKDQRFRGAGLFEAQKRIRAAQDTLADFASELMRSSVAADKEMSSTSASILSDCRVDRLACEIIPYLSKYRSSQLPAEILAVASMPWRNLDDAASDLLEPDGDEEESLQAGHFASLDQVGAKLLETPLYDEEGRRIDVKMYHCDGPLAEGGTHHNLVDVDDRDDSRRSNSSFDDEIEDSD